MTKLIRAFLVILLLLGAISCQNRTLDISATEGTVAGFVFDDKNGNGEFDPGTDRPMNDVKVSNGLDIAATDKKGVYELPLRDNAPIFVIKPSGYSLPLDKDNKPVFYHMNVPAGASGESYQGIDPTGSIDGVLNFALYKNEEPNNIKVLVFGDTQVRDNKEISYLQQDIIDDLIGTDADFGITLGDVVYDDLDIFGNLASSIADIGIPWIYVPGNHDIDHSVDNNIDALGAWYDTFGPDYYSFNYGPAHFVVLNDIRWITDTLGSRYMTGFGEAQFEFFRRDLELMESDQLLVLLTHIPFTNSTAWVDITERERFFALLSNHPSSLTLAAHTHVHYHDFIDSLNGYPGETPHHMVSVGTTCGSWWTGAPDEFGVPHATMADGTPVSYNWLNIDGNSWKMRWQGAGRDSEYQMQIGAPAAVADSTTNKNIIVTANIYNALPNADVRIRIDDQGWIPMEREVKVDSVRLAMNIAERTLGSVPWRPLGFPSPSKHLWEAQIDLGGLTPGTHLLEVVAQDQWWNYKGYRQIMIEN
jgi:hypothetical protein